jgi:hypothetical protein
VEELKVRLNECNGDISPVNIKNGVLGKLRAYERRLRTTSRNVLPLPNGVQISAENANRKHDDTCEERTACPSVDEIEDSHQHCKEQNAKSDLTTNELRLAVRDDLVSMTLLQLLDFVAVEHG